MCTPTWEVQLGGIYDKGYTAHNTTAWHLADEGRSALHHKLGLSMAGVLQVSIDLRSRKQETAQTDLRARNPGIITL